MRIYKVYPKTKARTKTMDRAKEQVFIDAVRERRHQMYRVALGYLHSAQDAEDAVSDAVESTWKSLKHIRNEEAIPAYLIRCTINAAKSMLRKKKRTEPLEPYQETLAVGESGDPITDYLSGMKEKDQLLLVLKYQENLREADIASILNIPRGTVSSLNHTTDRTASRNRGDGRSELKMPCPVSSISRWRRIMAGGRRRRRSGEGRRRR